MSRSVTEQPPMLFRGDDIGFDKTQCLVTVWPDGSAEITFREDQWDSWGPPHPLRRAE